MHDETEILTEGLIRNEAVFDLDMTDFEVNAILDQRITEAENHWYGKEWHLDKVYKANRALWLPQHLQDEELYDHELPYQDPRIFVSTETLVSQANARPGTPEVAPGSETPAASHLAHDLEASILAWCRDHKMKLIQRQVTRGVMVNRHAYAFLYFDPNYGTHGEIRVEYVSGKDVLVDPEAKMGENPRYFIRTRRRTLQQLITLFPEKKQALLEMAGRELGLDRAIRGVKSQLGKVYAYRECWYTYQEDDGTECEAVAFKIGKLVLGNMSMPNWNDNGKNFLPMPLKPFIPLNYLNLGDSYIDHTTLIEQAAAAQKLLDKRGRQASLITDQSSGGLIFNSQMIKKEEGMKLTGHPQEKTFVDGDVRSAVVRLAPADVSPAIIADKEDARVSIDNTFGTHAPTRGASSGNATLGQDVLQTQKDLTRNDELIRAIDQFFHDFYNYLVQMMVVYYDEEHWFDAVGDDGKFDRICMTSKTIDRNCKVYVEPGSTLPIDKVAMRETSKILISANMTDPLSVYEDFGLSNPSKRLQRLFTWTNDPQKMIQDMDEENFDRMAFMDLQVILAGDEPLERNDITERYLKYFTDFIKSGPFRDLADKKNGPKIQKAIVKFLQKEVEILKEQLKLEEATLPTQDEMAQGNKTAVEQAAMQSAIMQGQPQDAAAAAMASAQPPTTPGGAEQPPMPPGTSMAVQSMPSAPTGDTPPA